MNDIIEAKEIDGAIYVRAEELHRRDREIERLREFVSGLACDCEGEQCKVYGEDYLRLDCGYRKARSALGEKE